jgi:hypothetical protein
MKRISRPISASVAAFTFVALTPSAASACACGCGVFDIGGIPVTSAANSGQVFIEYDFMNQNRNWSGTSRASAANNDDKQIRTNFLVLGAQYNFSNDWGVMLEVPVTHRLFRTENDEGTGVDSFRHTALGDIRLMATYSGLSRDMSTGLTFGVKVPSGDWRYGGFDRDTSIGSGSTDLLFGGYHTGKLSKDGKWSYFVQGQYERAVAIQGGYRPGDEFDGDIGVSHPLWSSGNVTVAPMLQLIGSVRAKDSGVESNRPDSGYQRLLLSPGIEVQADKWKLYGDVEFPVYQKVNGNQLTAPALFKVVLSRRF